MKSSSLFLKFFTAAFLLQSCGINQDLLVDDVYAVKKTEVELVNDLDFDTTSLEESFSAVAYNHDFSVNKRLRNENLFNWGQSSFPYYTRLGIYNYSFRWYTDYSGRRAFIEQGFSVYNPFVSFYGWNGYLFPDQWNFTGNYPTSINSPTKGNYTPGSITTNGLYLRGPRGSISGLGGVTSRGTSYKSTVAVPVPNTGRTPVGNTPNTPIRVTQPASQNNGQVKPSEQPATTITPARREPVQTVRRPSGSPDRNLSRGSTSRGTVSPARGTARNVNVGTRTNGRP
jgi:hypothetical protein